MNKPVKPNETLPSSFGGVKENFSASKISSGYQKNIRDILGGANLNYLLDVIGKKDIYHDSITDYINALPINKTIMTDANNNLVYTQYDIRVYDATETYYKDDYVTGYDNDNEKYIYKSLVNNNLNHPVTDNDYWAKVSIIGNGFVRNIGEVVTSVLPLNDSGLHLLDGALIQGTGIYTAFVNYIATLYGDGTNVPAYFTSEANWQSTVATYGVCGKFVYNSTNNTVRLPKVTGLIEGTIDLNALGDLVEAGLPNITGYFCSTDDNRLTGYVGGAFSYARDAGNGAGGGSNETALSFDASRSSSIYGNSNTVQPQTIKVLYYIVVSTSTKTEIEVDIDDIATDLNGKADVDLSNTSPSQSFKNNVIPWGIPDYANGISVSSSTLTYTAPAQGFIYFNLYGGAAGYLFPIKINNVEVPSSSNTGAGEYRNTFSYLVDKNDVITWRLSLAAAVSIAFYPLKGAN